MIISALFLGAAAGVATYSVCVGILVFCGILVAGQELKQMMYESARASAGAVIKHAARNKPSV